MGNNALIAHKKGNTGVYLHWNGGADSVKPFLKVAEMMNISSSGFNENGGGVGELFSVANNFIGGSVYIESFSEMPHHEYRSLDNGIFFVDGWDIVGRSVDRDYFTEQNGHDYEEMLYLVNSTQSEVNRAPLNVLASDRIKDFSSVKVGDTVYAVSYNQDSGRNEWREHNVIKVTNDKFRGHCVEINKYTGSNPNNFFSADSHARIYIHNESRYQKLLAIHAKETAKES